MKKPISSQPKPVKVLFVSRTYPPVIGGMEKLSYQLIKNLSNKPEIKATALVNTNGPKALFFFFPMALIRTVLAAKKFDIIHLSDAVLSPIGEMVKLFRPSVKVVCNIHGLDVTYAQKNSFYRNYNLKGLNFLDKIFAVSEATKAVAVKMGLKKEKITVIPNAINPDEYYDPTIKYADLIEFLKHKKPKFIKNALSSKKQKPVFILTLGRLCERKGVAWFLDKVMPNLNSNIYYLIAGDGANYSSILQIIKKNKLSNRALLLGAVTEEQKKILLNSCDLFIQPNIKVPGDMEGFGISVIEAAACKMVVIASRLQGIKQALIHKENGFLVKSKDTQAFQKKINSFADQKKARIKLGEKFRQYTIENYSWQVISQKYLQEFIKVIKN
ncbi:MAG: glycosyltransferase [Candidatus Moranbacteria bacterium]|nr:glycosyltransferase [Candidatus Moranbacteria bacterium]